MGFTASVVLLGFLRDVKRGGRGKGRWRLAHDRELCTLCGGCPPLCPEDALAVHETYLDIDRRKCTACGACAPGCPTGALRMEGTGREAQGAGDEGARGRGQGAREGISPTPSSRSDLAERGPR
jgi:ferredoxin